MKAEIVLLLDWNGMNVLKVLEMDAKTDFIHLYGCSSGSAVDDDGNYLSQTIDFLLLIERGKMWKRNEPDEMELAGVEISKQSMIFGQRSKDENNRLGG